MYIIRDSSKIPEKYLGSAIAIGNFDGLHLGHQEVIRITMTHAGNLKAPVGLLTFEPHPRRVFKPDLPPLRITSFSEKARILAEMGVDMMRVIRFTKAFATTTAESFVKDILVGELKVAHVITGDNFIFGHNREGNVYYMQEMAKKLGFKYTVCPQVTVGNERISSTRIRNLLEQGKVEDVAHLLGRPYSIIGIVRAGDKRGRTIGFPTANILPGRIFTPARGVYAIKARIRDQLVYGVANLGVRPTFGGERLQLEVHLFDWKEDIYHEHMEVIFVKHLRAEKKFDGIESLKSQIAEDCGHAENILKSLVS